MVDLTEMIFWYKTINRNKKIHIGIAARDPCKFFFLQDDDVKTITCVEFDDDGDQFLITGDTDGNITLWDDSRSGVYQVVRVIQAHMVFSTVLRVLFCLFEDL